MSVVKLGSHAHLIINHTLITFEYPGTLMAFFLFLSFFERLNNSECDRPSLNPFQFLGENFLPLVYIGVTINKYTSI